MRGQFSLKLPKCSFAQNQIKYLGHLVSKKGVEPVQKKVKAIQQWPQPRTIRALRGFLRLVGFYRRFIKGYATLIAPLTKLLTHDQFMWSSEIDLAFQSLKDDISNTPILVLPNFTILFVVETDASGSGMGR